MHTLTEAHEELERRGIPVSRVTMALLLKKLGDAPRYEATLRGRVRVITDRTMERLARLKAARKPGRPKKQT